MFSFSQIAAKSILEGGDKSGLNQSISDQQSPGGGAGRDATTPENAAKRFEDDDSWRAKFLLKVQVRKC